MISSNVILTLEDLQETVDYFQRQESFVFDVETVGEHRGIPKVNQVTWIALATHGMTKVIPMGHPNGNVMISPPTRRKNPETKKFDLTPARYDEPPVQLRPSQVFPVLKSLMFSDQYKCGHGALFDFLSVAKYYDGEIPSGPYDDTIIMTWLVNENRLKYGLKELTISDYKRKYDNDNTGRQVEIWPFNKIAQYAYMDAKFTWLRRLNMLEDLEAEGMLGLYRDLEMPVFEVLLGMRDQGVVYDEEEARRILPILTEKSQEAEGRVYKAAGYKFNLNSQPQKVKALYTPKKEGGQGLKPWRLTKGGMKKEKAGQEIELIDYSTDKIALERWPNNKLVSAILDYQEVTRVLGTYVEGYLGVEGDPKKPTQIVDGKVYPDFVQYGTVTGRFSCREPNLQNIPRPTTDLGKAVRGLFVAAPGHKLIVADYGQVELVVLAHFIARGALYDGFYAGVDPHTVTASLVFDVALEDVTKDQRQDAKNINFAVVYGAGTAKVAAMSKTSEKRAKAFLAKHQREFPEIYIFKGRVVETCRSRKPIPYIKTILGRKRRLPTMWAKDPGVRWRAERQAVNSLIQGSSADLIKTAMIRVNSLLAEQDAGRLILTVHDELVAQAPENRAEKCAELVREGMTGAGIQSLVKVPLSIDMKIVDKWSEAK